MSTVMGGKDHRDRPHPLTATRPAPGALRRCSMLAAASNSGDMAAFLCCSIPALCRPVGIRNLLKDDPAMTTGCTLLREPVASRDGLADPARCVAGDGNG
ncbi:MAG: hypothetical protein IAE87_02655 [Rhodobacteraceae bacterium]|nr:hypothetical protein [Paracoccaceae bacterium]